MLLLAKMLIKSFFVGVCGACAVGPIFLLILNRSLEKGFLIGLLSAVGVALADGIFFSMGLAGSLSVASHSAEIIRGFEFFGGLVLIVFGVGSLLGIKTNHNSGEQVDIVENRFQRKTIGTHLWMTLSAFLINISNPMSLVFFATIASKAFPELVGIRLPLRHFLYAGIFATLGSTLSFGLVGAFASVVSCILFKKMRVFLEGFTATFFLGMGLYLVVGFLKFMFENRGII